MASNTTILKTRKKLKRLKMGRKRKNRLAIVGSTPTRAAFFGDDAPAKVVSAS